MFATPINQYPTYGERSWSVEGINKITNDEMFKILGKQRKKSTQSLLFKSNKFSRHIKMMSLLIRIARPIDIQGSSISSRKLHVARCKKKHLTFGIGEHFHATAEHCTQHGIMLLQGTYGGVMKGASDVQFDIFRRVFNFRLVLARHNEKLVKPNPGEAEASTNTLALLT